MHLGERDLAGWAELRAWQDDDRLGAHVRRLRIAYEAGDHAVVRAEAHHLIVDLPRDYAAAQDLLRRLRDVGE
jgi:hypothetical protein